VTARRTLHCFGAAGVGCSGLFDVAIPQNRWNSFSRNVKTTSDNPAGTAAGLVLSYAAALD
jgi:hypothetical protein